MLISSQRLCSTSSFHPVYHDDYSVHEHLNPCSLLDSETNRKIFSFKEEFDTFKVQAISKKTKRLILEEISVLKEAINTHFNTEVLSGKAKKEKFYQE